MPSFDVKLNLPGFSIEKSSGFNPIIYDLKNPHAARCPHCGSGSLRTKDRILRLVWHESTGLRRVLLRFCVCKYLCRACGRYFRQRLADYLAQWPAIERIYSFKEELMKVLSAKNQSKKQCRSWARCLLDAIAQLQQSGFEECRKLAKTMESWQEEIARMWRFSRSNGITEGYHRKMKLIQHRVFGFRNFENYRIRLRVFCA